MRQLVAAAVVVLLIVGYISGASPPSAAPDPLKRTVVFAALGDSITTAAGTCGPYFLCLDSSWATGTRVYSVYQRLRSAKPHVNVYPVNLAGPGAGADDLYVQAMQAVERKADYVTILIGANDACRWPMTDPRAFRADIDDALQILKQRRPRPRIVMVSIPDVVNLWTLVHDHVIAMLAWQFKECPSLMANAASTASADVHRRQSIGRRIKAYNRELGRACRQYGDRCQWDRGRAHRVKFTLELVGLDYFHPNLRGQQELAKVPLPASWTGK